MLVAGVDEVGRGCLAGEVVAGACVLPAEWGLLTLRELRKKHPELKHVTDSKLLDPGTRAELAPWIRANVRAFGIGACTVSEIDRLNIFHASHQAMIRAVANLRCRHDGSVVEPHWLLVDGKFLPREWPSTRAKAIIKGDLHSISIACASILAKVHRDDAISALDAKYPGYGFASHKGYATPEHREALARLGVTELHRRSFAPVREQMVKGTAAEPAPEFAFDFGDDSETSF